MTARERIRTIFEGGLPDRVGSYDSIWVTTLKRWRKEGLPGGVSPLDHFGMGDIVRVGGDDTLQFPIRVIEQGDGSKTYVDPNGVTRRDLDTGAGWTPQWLDFTIRDRDSWERHRHRAEYNGSRLTGDAFQLYERARKTGKYVMYYGHLCYHTIWHWVGQEKELMWMVEQPDLLHDMFGTFTDLVIRIYEGFRSQGMEFDGVFMADDMGYRNGTQFSPEAYRCLVYPYHKAACDYFAREGLPVTLHSDGDVREFIPMFIDAGFRSLHPLESKCGMDVRELKRAYGDRLVLQGNIDVRKLASTKERIEEEIREKLLVAKQDGGYIYHSDHSVPDDVSFENYAFAMEMVQKYGTYEEGVKKKGAS